MARYFKLPAPIQLLDDEGQPVHDVEVRNGQPTLSDRPMKPVTFRRFVRDVLMGDPKWKADVIAIRSAFLVLSAIDDARDTGVVKMDDEAWDTLRAVAKALPPNGFGTLALVQLLPFFDAIENATTKPLVASVPAEA